MEYQKSSSSSNDTCYTNERWESMIRVSDEEDELLNNGLRKGHWSPEEDSKLSSAIATHGVGRWKPLEHSCRFRRWSKIAKHLPGRTDYEIKNYWRTKVQKLARQFQCPVNSPQFRNALRNIWIPRLVEQIQAGATTSSNTTKAHIHGPTYDSGNGLLDGFYRSSSTSSDDCCFFDTPLSWAQNSYIVGPEELCPKPNVSTDSSEAHISPVSGSSVELDQNWDQINDYLREMTLNGEDNILFWETLHNKTLENI